MVGELSVPRSATRLRIAGRRQLTLVFALSLEDAINPPGQFHL